MQRLRSEFGVYGVDSGRICVAALNSQNIDAVVQAIANVDVSVRCRRPTVAVRRVLPSVVFAAARA